MDLVWTYAPECFPARMNGPDGPFFMPVFVPVFVGLDGWDFLGGWKVKTNQLTALLTPVIQALGYECLGVEYAPNVRGSLLRVYIDVPGRAVAIEDCERVSREISAALDVNDPIRERYTLEVSSPGIDRPLTRLKDYHDWQGYEAKIELDRMIEGRKKFKGVLAGVDGDNVEIDIDGEAQTALIPFAWISSARLVLTDELIRESLKAAKDALKETPHEDAGQHDHGDTP